MLLMKAVMRGTLSPTVPVYQVKEGTARVPCLFGDSGNAELSNQVPSFTDPLASYEVWYPCSVLDLHACDPTRIGSVVCGCLECALGKQTDESTKLFHVQYELHDDV